MQTCASPSSRRKSVSELMPDNEIRAFGGASNLARWRNQLRHTRWESLRPLEESRALTDWWGTTAQGYVRADVRMELLARATDDGWSTLPTGGWAHILDLFRPDEQSAWRKGGPSAAQRKHGSWQAAAEYCCWRDCTEITVLLTAAPADDEGDVPLHLPDPIDDWSTYVDDETRLRTAHDVAIRPLVNASRDDLVADEIRRHRV
jgi:hypothetical protein